MHGGTTQSAKILAAGVALALVGVLAAPTASAVPPRNDCNWYVHEVGFSAGEAGQALLAGDADGAAERTVHVVAFTEGCAQEWSDGISEEVCRVYDAATPGTVTVGPVSIAFTWAPCPLA